MLGSVQLKEKNMVKMLTHSTREEEEEERERVREN